MYGCCQYQKEVGGDKIANDELDTEQGTSAQAGSTSITNTGKSSGANEDLYVRQIAGFWGYVFQIIFQVILSQVFLILML